MHDPVGDSCGSETELKWALCQPELQRFLGEKVEIKGNWTPERAACYLAICLGNCRLYGVEIEKELDGVLPSQVAISAAQVLLGDISGTMEGLGKATLSVEYWVDSYDKLEMDPDEVKDIKEGKVVDEIETEGKACDYLISRTDYWAAFLAINEAYQALLRTRSEEAGTLRPLITQLAAALRNLDSVMESRIDLLKWAASTYYLENMREALAEDYRCGAWWLDGRLEKALKGE